MKKLALTSLFAVFAVSGAHAANVINDNPLYRPEAGKFYSVTSVASHTKNSKTVGLTEDFGYGITDRLAVAVSTTAAQSDWFDMSSWNDFAFGVNYRALDMGNWKGDVFGAYTVNSILPYRGSFLDKDATWYNWTVGARAGYEMAGWSVAGHIAFDYANSESFNWNDEGIHSLRAGLTGLLALNSNWSLVAGVEYSTILDDEINHVKIEHPGQWDGTFGVNYNIDSDKFVGAYISKTMDHDAAGDWDVQDGFAFGAKFGIDF